MGKIKYSSMYDEIKTNKSFTFKVNEVNFIIRKYDYLIVENEMRFYDFVYVNDVFESSITNSTLIEVCSMSFKEKYLTSLNKVIGKINVINDKYILNKSEVKENE